MKDIWSILKFLLPIFGGVALLLGVIWSIDALTFAINKKIWKSSYNNPTFHYRIKDTSDLQMEVLKSTKTFFAQRFANDSADVCVIAMTLIQDSPIEEISKRLTYKYAEKLDTLYYPFLKDLELITEKKPFWANDIIREYSYSGESNGRVKTVTIFAREYIYTFIQQYNNMTPDLLNRLVYDFKSSRTFCVQNLLATWSDRLCGNDYGIVYNILKWAWFIVCLLFCLWLINFIIEHIKYSICGVICLFLVVILFIYLVLHDSLSDWLMSFGSFGQIPLQLWSMFFDD